MLIYILVFHYLCKVSGQEHSLHFTETPSDISAIGGSSILLKCQAQGNGENIRYSWKHNREPVRLTTRKRLIDGNLSIKHLNGTQDAGDYICEAKSLATEQRLSSQPAKVRVKWMANVASVAVVQPELAAQIISERQMTLECQASGSNFTVSWLRNGELITKSDRMSMEGNRVHAKNLTPADNGVYRCFATNEAGSAYSLKNFALTIPSEDGRATIQVLPEDKVVKGGTSARIDCVYQNADLIEWYFQEKEGPIHDSPRFTVLSNGSLIVNNMTANEEGIYSCVGIKRDSPAVPQKYTAQLYVSTLETMNSTFLDPHEPASHIVATGFDFEIQCFPPAGNPPPAIRWKNATGDFVGTGGHIRANGTTLVIRKASAETDPGRYTCRAENLAGFQEVSFNFTVAVLPVVTKHPISQKVNEGANVQLTCEFTGVPYPFTQVLWYKDETLITMNTTRTYLNVANGTLRLSSVELSDAGNYYCLVKTSPKMAVKSNIAALNIEQKLKFHPLPMGKKMELGMTNKIPCKAEGKDIPTVKWIKGNSLNASTPFPNHVQDLNGTLFFSSVQKEDEGQYMCMATNSQGEINVVIDVAVVVTPKFTILPKNPSEGYEGFALMMDCVAEGDPLPTIQWDNKNVDLTQDRFHILANGSLLIDELHFNDEGYYGCTAGNSGGFNRTEVTLIVRNSEHFRSDGTMDGIEGDTVGKTVVITLGAACTYILLVVILMAWCRYRRRKKKQSYMEANMENTELDDDETGVGRYHSKNPVELRETVVVQNGESHCILDEGQTSQSSSRSRRSTDTYDSLSFSRRNVDNIMLLGKGEFGSVYLGQNSQNSNAVVMVKVLEDITEEFNRQLDILTHVEHENVVKLIGLCREMQPHYMILEYTDWV